MKWWEVFCWKTGAKFICDGWSQKNWRHKRIDYVLSVNKTPVDI